MNKMIRKDRINVVLDLDNTLISAIDPEEIESVGTEIFSLQKSFKCVDMDDDYKIFQRPYLQYFLTWLFANFNVSVWTAATKSYALFIIQNFIISNRQDRKLDYILFSNHCDESKKISSYEKSLLMMSEIYPVGYNINNTYIIDDNEEVFKAQPNKCILVKPFNVLENDCRKDKELLKVKKILEQKLELLS